jgi:hypothetical protein
MEDDIFDYLYELAEYSDLVQGRPQVYFGRSPFPLIWYLCQASG